MKKLHIEFDLFAADKTAEGLTDTPEICLTDNILEALEATDECEYIDNFKIHNLTSDEEGEEMLTVSRKDVQDWHKGFTEEIKELDELGHHADAAKLNNVIYVLDDLFGSKCLPDNVDNLE